MAIDKETIKKDIVDQLYWDDRVNAADVKVEIKDNTAKLTGSVPNYAARTAAWEDALTVVGIAKVENNLMVKHPPSVTVPTDEEISTNIKSIIDWNPVIDSDDMTVSVVDGVVTLKGTVNSYWKRLKAEDLCADVAGVIDIINELAVVPTGDFVDKSIADDIVMALERNVPLHVDAVKIEVDNGAVTVSGTVSDRLTYRAVLDTIQYTPGVTRIIKQLEVKPKI